jgi:hypothetical protein
VTWVAGASLFYQRKSTRFTHRCDRSAQSLSPAEEWTRQGGILPFASPLVITPAIELLPPPGLEEHHSSLPVLVSELRDPDRRSVRVG